MDPANQATLPASRASFRERKGWGLSEVLFFLVVACAMVAVFFCGRFAYREGSLLEDAKGNGQAVARWAESMAEANAKGEAVTPTSCAAVPGSSGEDPVPATWQACREALFAADGPFHQLRNPFNEANTVLGTKCERKSAATRGHVLVEKGTPPPPGVTGNVTWSPSEGKDALAKGLALRVQVCDAGGYSIRVTEVTL